MKNTRAYTTGAAIAIFVVLICALILRLYDLNKYDLWFDEQGTDMFALENLVQTAALSGVPASSVMVDNMKNDPHSSLYYLFVYAYSAVFGGGRSLRVLSVLFSMLSLGLFYRLSRLLFNRNTSMYALVIMAFSPFHLWYAQEARVYATACFFSLLLVYVYMQALKTGRRFYWISFPVAGILAIFLSYYSGLLFITTGAALFFRRNRRYVKKWILSLFAVSIFFLFFRHLLIAQVSFVRNSFWLPFPSGTALLFTWKFFSLGYSATPIQYQIGLLLFFPLFGYGAYFYYRRNKVNTIILLLLLFLPIIATYIFSKLIRPVYIHRQLIIFSPIYYLFIAKGIESIGHKRIQIVAIVSVVALMTGSLINYYRGYMFPYRERGNVFLGVVQKRNYSDLMRYMSEEFRKGDLIATADIPSYCMVRSHIIKHYKQHNYVPSEMFCFLAYPFLLHPFDAQYLRVTGLLEKLSSEKWKRLYVFSFFQDNKVQADRIQLHDEKFKRIWLISSTWDKGISFTPNIVSVRNYMDRKFRKVSSKQRDDIYIDLYIQKNR